MRLSLSLFSLLFLSLFCFSCNSADQQQAPVVDLTGETYQLEGGSLKILLPTHLKASSRYRIEEDIEYLQDDSLLLLLTQNNLRALEFEDESIDMFVNKEGPFHQVLIMDFVRTSLNKTNGSLLASDLKDHYEGLAYQTPNLQVEKVSSQLLPMKTSAYLKIKYLLTDKLSGRKLYNTHYVFTTNRQSYAIFEIVAREDDIEPYLWAWKER